MNKFLVNALKLVLFVGFGAAVLVLLYHKINAGYQERCAEEGIAAADCNLIDKVVEDFQNANFLWLLVVVLGYMMSNVHRAYRWKYLIDSLGKRTRFINIFNSTMLLYFANLGFPRMGEVLRAGTVARYEKINFEKLVGTVAVDRIFDMLSFVVLFLLGLALEYDVLLNYIREGRASVESDSSNVRLLGVLGGALVLGAIIIYALWGKLKQLSLVKRLIKAFYGFVEGLKSIRHLDNVPGFIFHSIMIWVMYFLMTYMCFQALDVTAHLGPKVALMVLVFGSLGMIIPSPGGMGTYQAFASACLVIYGIASEDAFSWAMIIFFTVNIFGNIIFGIIALIALPLTNRGYEPGPTSTRKHRKESQIA